MSEMLRDELFIERERVRQYDERYMAMEAENARLREALRQYQDAYGLLSSPLESRAHSTRMGTATREEVDDLSASIAEGFGASEPPSEPRGEPNVIGRDPRGDPLSTDYHGDRRVAPPAKEEK